mgnify:CR=1 FL=1|jgi:hypothetical protein
MKFILTMIICTSVYQQCLEPFPMTERYDSHYDCMLAGYNEAIDKANEIGRQDINKYGTIIKFFCMPEEDYPPEKKGSLT